MIVALREPKRILCTCREAAEIIGCTMGRVRQLCRAGADGGQPVLWSHKLTGRALVLDLAQVKKFAKDRRLARDAGSVRGAPPGGFQPDG